MGKKAKDEATVVSEEGGFPEKLLKKVPPDFVSAASSMSVDELKKVLVECEAELYNIDKERDADEQLTAAKNVAKDLGKGYRDVKVPVSAKLKYTMYMLDSRGQV